MQELFFSMDVETDGPIPGPHSMLSLGVVALLDDGREVGSFEVNLQELEGASGDEDTMKWWATQPVAWEACRKDLQEPATAMRDFVAWVERLTRQHRAQAVGVAYPAGFDFLFVYWYIRRFGLKSPFSFSCLDVKSYAAAVLKKPYRDSTKKNMPKSWFKDLPPHTHKALDDAREQGLLFLNIRKHLHGQS